VEDPTRYYGQARELAVKDAQDRAKALAALAGVTLGKPFYISESSYTPVPIQTGGFAVPAPAPAAVTPITPGETQITLTVQISYRIAK
jgi:uncharacterized protein YggE